MNRGNVNVPQLPQSPKRHVQGARPRSGCSEKLFNFDTPRTPHFDQSTSAGATMNGSASDNQLRGSTSSLRSNKINNLSSTVFDFASAESNPFNITEGFSLTKEKEIYVFIEQPNRKLCCPVCSNVFKDPVITTCGHTFCKVCVRESVNEVCPIDNKPSKYIVDNIALSEQIGELLIHCKYGCKQSPTTGVYIVDEEGCPATLKISERYEHEQACGYSPMSCPNNGACKQFLRKDLDAHLQTCSSFMCPNNKYGCTFVDTKQNIDAHVKSCIYENVKHGVEGESRFDQIKQENKSAREDIDFMLTSLRGLSQRFEQMETEKEQLIAHVNKMSVALEDAHKDLEVAKAERQMIMEELDQLKQMSHQIPAIGPYDPETIIKCKGTCVGHDGPVWCLAAVNDYLFSGSSDNHVKVWDISCNYKCVKTLGGHSGIVLALTVCGNRLYSGSQDTKILVWNIDSGFELETTLDAHDNPVCTLAASRGMVFSGSLKTVKVWNAVSGKHELKKEIDGFNHWVRALYATDKELYCGSYQTIEIYNLDTLEITTTLKTYGGSVYSICVTDKHILCGTYEKVIHVWELANMEQVTTLSGHSGTVYALTWMHSPGGILVFSASYDRTIRVWSQNNMICKQTLIRHAGSVACLAVIKGRLFSGGIDSMVKVWQ